MAEAPHPCSLLGEYQTWRSRLETAGQLPVVHQSLPRSAQDTHAPLLTGRITATRACMHDPGASKQLQPRTAPQQRMPAWRWGKQRAAPSDHQDAMSQQAAHPQSVGPLEPLHRQPGTQPGVHACTLHVSTLPPVTIGQYKLNQAPSSSKVAGVNASLQWPGHPPACHARRRLRHVPVDHNKAVCWCHHSPDAFK
jgi:hypothetical protein